MALTVNTNMASMNALNNLNGVNRNLSTSFRKISSGLRITQAGDDAAGLAVAENLDAASRSLQQAARNTNDGISVVQVAEGATAEVGNILKRMRELAVESSTETLADSERAYVQDEYEQLEGEISRISSVTEFNGVSLADGTNTSLDVQVGINDTANDRISLTLGDLSSSTLGVDTSSIDLSSATNAQSALTDIDGAIDTVNGYRSAYGSVQNRLESSLSNLENYIENLSAAESQIRDADFAFETAEMAKFQIMQQAGIAVLGQANAMSQGALRLVG